MFPYSSHHCNFFTLPGGLVVLLMEAPMLAHLSSLLSVLTSSPMSHWADHLVLTKVGGLFDMVSQGTIPATIGAISRVFLHMFGMSMSAHGQNQVSVTTRVGLGRASPGQVVPQKECNMDSASPRCWRSWKANLGIARQLRDEQYKQPTNTTIPRMGGNREERQIWRWEPASQSIPSPLMRWCPPSEVERGRNSLRSSLLQSPASAFHELNLRRRLLAKEPAGESQATNLRANRQKTYTESQVTMY